MVNRTRWVFLAAAFVLSSCQTHFVGGWLPWFQTSTSRTAELAAIQANNSLFNEVSLFWYGAHNNATTASGVSIDIDGGASALDPTAAAIRAQGLLVIPTIADGTSPGTMRAVLLDPAKRSAHEQQIIDLVQSKGYNGIDLDYEVFAFGDHMTKLNPTYTPVWVAFVNELADKLHANGKLLAVTVPAVWQDVSATDVITTSGYTFYAQNQIAAKIDRLRLMVYDWSVGSPGPIAPMSWDNKVIAYSTNVAKVPVAKLQLGVPAYGRHWAVQKTASETCPDGALYRESLTQKNAATFVASRGLGLARDASGELTAAWDQVVTGPRTTPIPPPIIPIVGAPVGVINATAAGALQPAQRLAPPSTFVTCTVHHVLYVPDATSVQQRATAAMQAGWHGIFIWALGYETADVYPALAHVGP